MRLSAQLRLALLRGSLRPGPGATGRRLGLLLGAVAGGVLAVLAVKVLSAHRGDGALPADLSVVLYSALLVGWVVIPVLTFGSDDLLDPARLALLPLTRRQLLTLLGVGGLVGVAPACTAVAALGLLPATAHSPGSTVVALLAAALLLALCVATSRAAAAGLSGVLRSRRGRDLGVVLAAVLGLGLQLLNPLVQLATRGKVGRQAVADLAAPLRWTPPGLLAAAPTRPAVAAAGSLVVGAAFLCVVLVLWERSVRRALERPAADAARRRRSSGLVPRGLPLPPGRVGAVAAKDLRVVLREPRRLVQTLTTSLLPVLAVTLGPLVLSAGRPARGLVFAGCGLGLLTGLGPANRFGIDGTATWLLVGSATDPRDARRDLLGGDVAAAVVAVPVLLLLEVALGAVTGSWELLPAATGTALALFGVGLGLSGLVAVAAPYAVPPSQNTFSSGAAGQGCAAGALLFLAMGAGTVVCLPLLVLLVPALLTGSPVLSVLVLVVGPAYGLGVGHLLRREAARRWEARAPEVLQVLVTARS